jgi:hypothetical protein
MNYALICQQRAARYHQSSLVPVKDSIRVYYQQMAAAYYLAARQALGVEFAP